MQPNDQTVLRMRFKHYMSPLWERVQFTCFLQASLRWKLNMFKRSDVDVWWHFRTFRKYTM